MKFVLPAEPTRFDSSSYLRIKDLTTTEKRRGYLSVSPATVWRWVSAGKFPRPIKIGPNVTVWSLSTVNDWIKQQHGEEV